jgi:hypothetical protein
MLRLALLLLLLPAQSAAGHLGSSDSAEPHRMGDNVRLTEPSGINTRTGSQWRTIINLNGDEDSKDSHGNMWLYNESTGTLLELSRRHGGDSPTVWPPRRPRDVHNSPRRHGDSWTVD